MMSNAEERRWLIFLLIMAAALRLWQFGFAAVEHFDEGVYASNFWFDASDNYRYPDRHLYAPPLLPLLIEWGHLFLGAGTLATMLPSLLAGLGSVGLVWLFMRRLAGPTGGLAAAGLWASQDLAILYSRTALTESLLCFWMLLAILLAERALQFCKQPHFSWQPCLLGAVACGGAAGLAWLTKYNGWLTLAILFSATPAWLIFSRAGKLLWQRSLVVLAVAGITAGLLWWPYLSSLQPLGGYAAVAENHQKYFVGLNGWTESLEYQARNYLALVSWTSLAGVLFCGVLLFRASLSAPESELADAEPNRESWCKRPGFWLVLSWWIGLSVAIPLYYPYPRLLLPWILARCLLLGMLLQWLADSRWFRGPQHVVARRCSPAQQQRLLWGLCGGVVLLAVLGPALHFPAWQDRRGLQQIAAHWIQEAGKIAREQGLTENQVVFYVYGEPALVYHLSAQQRLAGPIGHLDFADAPAGRVTVPTFLITGPHADDSPLFQQQWSKKQQFFQKIGEIDYFPSRFILLNQQTPLARTPAAAPIMLYQVVGDRH